MHGRILSHLLLAAALAAPAIVGAAAGTTVIPIKAKPGEKVLLTNAACFVEPPTAPVGVVEVDTRGAMPAAYITVPPERRDGFAVEVKTGVPVAGTAACTAGAELQLQVNIDTEPAVSMQSVQQAFVVLMAAFVLALLLESAFELLFNWRLFQEFFVGRAWRTPIMFAVSLSIVEKFDLNLLGRVFAAYNGDATAPDGGWLSAWLTAMIISGGSVGVNRILVALGFRPAQPKTEVEQVKLTATEAYVSIDVRGATADRQLGVEMHTADNDAQRSPTLGVLNGKSGGRLKQILFPGRSRIPRSGGFRVAADTKCYRFMVRDLRTNKLYNVDGDEIQDWQQASEFCFAPKAIVDFVVDLK